MSQEAGGAGGVARRPHICCAPPPCAPSAFRRATVLVKARPKPVRPPAIQPKGISPPVAQPPKSSPAGESGVNTAPEARQEGSDAVGGKQAWASVEKARQDLSAISPPSTDHYQENRESEEQQGVQYKPSAFFTRKQVRVLERAFRQQKYPDAKERKHLADALNLKELQVKTWFQNQRTKMKKQETQNCYYGFESVSPFPLQYNPRIQFSPVNHFAMNYLPSQQTIPPFIQSSARPFDFPGSSYQPFPNPSYPFFAPGLPYHHPPLALTHPFESCDGEHGQSSQAPHVGDGEELQRFSERV